MTKKVIIADDALHFRELYATIIPQAFPDVEVETVETAEDLVSCVLNGDYSLIVTDNNTQSRINGAEAIKQIREAGITTPIYMISAGSAAVQREALRLGATEFYGKALFDDETFITDITKHLR
ncbi:response regulator [Candidatus Woesearchaeota archaeon]|nr:response regulator [Candidatus Woesearchaeota archaeon]